MIHNRRRFCVSLAATAEELAQKLVRNSWTLCSGFEIGGYLFLNDAFSENGAQEYAVFKKPESQGGQFSQVESITFSWCDEAEALDLIQRTLAGDFDGDVLAVEQLNLDERGQHSRCHLCA